MKTSLLLIAVVSAQIASAQYYADGSPRINRQLRGLGRAALANGNPISALAQIHLQIKPILPQIH